VVALATAARRAAAGADGLLGEQLARHAEEARAHVELWRRFAHGVGWGCGSAWHYGEDPLAETVACARAWAGNPDRSLAAHLVTLYAVESVQPRVAQLALDGLRAHYGVADGPATAWFRARIAAGDRAGLVRAGLAGLLRGGDDDDAADALLRQAEAAHRAHWELLDGLERVAGSPYQAVQPPSTRSTEPVTLPEASQAR
jgi:pyrroloquinoline quinone (PQQ) biosynthesis protein C